MEKIGTGGAGVQDRGSDSGISRLLRSIRGQKKSKEYSTMIARKRKSQWGPSVAVPSHTNTFRFGTLISLFLVIAIVNIATVHIAHLDRIGTVSRSGRFALRSSRKRRIKHNQRIMYQFRVALRVIPPYVDASEMGSADGFGAIFCPEPSCTRGDTAVVFRSVGSCLGDTTMPGTQEIGGGVFGDEVPEFDGFGFVDAADYVIADYVVEVGVNALGGVGGFGHALPGPVAAHAFRDGVVLIVGDNGEI